MDFVGRAAKLCPPAADIGRRNLVVPQVWVRVGLVPCLFVGFSAGKALKIGGIF
jgi:hypothetical protein